MLTLNTPNQQQINGNSRLDTYTFTGKYDRKFFTVGYTGPGVSNVTFTLSATGGSGGFRIFPADSTSLDQTTLTVSLNNNDKISFSVDYNSEWGDANYASLFSDEAINSSPLYTYTLLGPTASLNFKLSDNLTVTKREIGSLLVKDDSNSYLVSQAGTKISQSLSSFGLARTNPKLTGNVKITIDSTNSIWMNSIDAVKELSDDKYKKFKIGTNSSYAADLTKFFDSGSTPPEIVYALYQNDKLYTATKRNLSEQYDRFYQYGVSELNSRFYTENFSFFAPLYLKTDIPEYFVIFRTDGAINKFSYDLPFDQWPANVVSEILNNSTIVKTFSLAENTPIGSYLRNIINHPSRSESDLTVSYQTDGYTSFNGIAYTKSSHVQMGELLYDYISQENPLIATEEFFTQGFERNKVISSHIINLEFLFDDNQSEDYSINRYFGFYVNSIDLAKFNISAGGLQAFSKKINQLPIPRHGIDGNPISEKSFTQTNTSGISIFLETSSIDRNNINEKLFTSIIENIIVDSSNLYLSVPGNVTEKLFSNDSIKIVSSSGSTATGIVNAINYDSNITTISIGLPSINSSLTPGYIASMVDTWTCNFYTDEKFDLFKQRIFDNTFIENTPRFFFVKDNIGDLHSVKKTSIDYYNSDPFTTQKVIELKLGDTSLDISKFGGFSNILSQDFATPLKSRGRSSIEIEITNYFSPNDYIEISWNPGLTASGYPLRWRVVANSTGTKPGETWPAYSINTDSKGQYYVAYFNPGDSSIDLSVFTKSIEKAFNRFEFKDFEVLAKNKTLYFRSTQEGRSSNNETVEINTYAQCLKIMGISVSNTEIVSFNGGSDRFNTRAKITSDVASGILPNEYFVTKAGFSLPTKYNISGTDIMFSSYLEEPVYDSEDKLIDFKGCETYKTVCLIDESSPISVTNDKKITSYELFSPSFGILSIFPLRDFDTDFFYSDYTKNYLPELIEYFGINNTPSKIVNITGSAYQLDKNFSFDSYPVNIPYLSISDDGIDSPVLHNTDCQLQFLSPGATAYLVGITGASGPNIGDNVLLMNNDKHLYFLDEELSKFKGLLSLSGVISYDDEQNFKVLENQWDPNRFTLHLLNSEYDRLSENYLKTFVLKSRVVPYISKWVSTDGKDIRDNQYRFNYHRSFGNMSFSPSDSMIDADPRYHTHEWPYLHAVPDKFPIEDFSNFAFSYMFDNLTSIYDFSSIERDWFSEYFIVGYPSELYMDINGNFIPAKIDTTEKYSVFKQHTFNNTTTTLFRGYKFSITELNDNGQPILSSTKYDNYKFSAIIESIEDNNLTSEDPISFKMIVNEKWKFIVLKIVVKTSSYKFTEGRLRYSDLYTLLSNYEIADYVYDSSYSILSGYRTIIPTDRKISGGLNLNSYSGDSSLITYFDYYDTFYNSSEFFAEDLREDVTLLENGLFSDIIGTYESSYYRMSSNVSSPSPYGIYSKRTLKLSGNNAYLKLSTILSMIPVTIPYIFNWKDFNFYQQGGGNISYSGLRERLTFSEILKVIEGVSDKSRIEYSIVSETGVVKNISNFFINGISPEELTRILDYYPVDDSDKPHEFYNYSHIGAVLDIQKDLQTLYRYQGNFEPKFRDVIKFWLREDEVFTSVSSLDFLLNNTHIGTELIDFSILKNQFYNKVSDKEILRLSPSSSYLPVYPLVDEISIDKKDIFAWSSSWDNSYYRKYTSVSDYFDIKGTYEMTETKSLLGSKVMKTPKQYDLYEFNTKNGTSSDLSSLINEEFSYYEDSKYAYVQINAYNRLLREMLGTSTDLRAKKEFIKTLDIVANSFVDDSIENYVTDYLTKNILNLYDISQTKLYVLKTSSPFYGNLIAGDKRPLIETTLNSSGNLISLSETELLNRGYILYKDAKVTNLGSLTFQIKYPLDSRYYTSLSIGVSLNRI